MLNPIVTLTTDFGTRDHFVGVMKGVILSICPDAVIVDISHDVQPFAISEGAFLVAQAFCYFPAKTVHVVVVDPGVGTARRPILIEAGGQFFVGPDNGVLSMVYSEMEHKAREITTAKYLLQPVSRTFHGRDIFAPVAAHLAKGVRPSSIGKLIEDRLKPGFSQPHSSGNRIWLGSVLHVDRFGNLITNFHIDTFADIRVQPFEFAVGATKLTRLGVTFADVGTGEPFVIVGSSGYLEVAVNQASASRILNCGAGAPCELTIF